MDLYLSPQDGGLSLQEMLDCDIKTEIDSVLLGGSGGSSEFGLGDLPPLDLLDSSLDGTGFGGLCGTGSGGTGLNGMMMLSPLELANVGPTTDMVSWLSSSSGTCVGGVSSVGGSGSMGLDLDAAGMMVSPSSVMPLTIIRQKPESKVPSLESTEKHGMEVTLAATTTTSTIPTTTVSLTQVKSYTLTNSGMLPKSGNSHRIAVSNGVPLLRTTISTSRQLQSSPKHQYQQVTTTTPSNNHSNHVMHSSRGGNSQQKRFINAGRVYTQHIPTSSSSSSTDSLDDGGGGNNNISAEKMGRSFPKPAYSYSCLIAMALKNSTTGSLPVSEIYNFMCEHFPYFKTAPNGWKNSVRHNLSLNKCFEKIEKPSSSSSPSSSVSSSGVGSGGSQQRKGCLWAMNPAKIPKMDEEVQKWSRKDPNAIRKAMICPDNLELLERGDMKRDVSSAGSMSCEESEDEEAGIGSVGVSSPNPTSVSIANAPTPQGSTTTTYLVGGRRVGGVVVSSDRGYFRKVKHKVEEEEEMEEEEEEADEEEEEVEVDEEEEVATEVVEEDGVMDGVVVLEDDVKTENDMGDYMDIKMELLDGTNIVDFDLDVAEGIYEELGDDRLNLGVNITSSSSLAASSSSHLSPSTITISESKETTIGASPTVIPLSAPTIQGNYVYKASRRKAGGPLLLSSAGAIRKLNGL